MLWTVKCATGADALRQEIVGKRARKRCGSWHGPNGFSARCIPTKGGAVAAVNRSLLALALHLRSLWRGSLVVGMGKKNIFFKCGEEKGFTAQENRNRQRQDGHDGVIGRRDKNVGVQACLNPKRRTRAGGCRPAWPPGWTAAKRARRGTLAVIDSRGVRTRQSWVGVIIAKGTRIGLYGL